MTSNGSVYKVLFLCTGNSARSILAEAILNRVGDGRFIGYSAGSQPTGKVNETARELLTDLGYDTSKLRSKSWQEFGSEDRASSPETEFDLVVTVCDSAAKESCPVWVGHPLTVHWGLPDPAAVTGDDVTKRAAFDDCYAMLSDRIKRLVRLPLESMTRPELTQVLQGLGQTLPQNQEML
ncbi:MAG: arsenate reductase ArsC [Pseudomonadales bacterium]